MRSRNLVLSMAVAGVFACLPARAFAQATIANQPVYFTFGNPVALPGMTLQPGQYQFRMTTDKGDRQVVQVYDKKNNKAVATLMAISAHLTNAQPVPEKPEVRFYETPANQPPAIQSWWYPGIHDGHEFIYPRQQAQAMAKLNPQGVPTTTEPAVESGQVTRAMPSDAAASANAPAPASVSARNEAPSPAVNQAPTPAQPAPTRRTLPQTATDLPALGLLGAITLIGGLTLMFRRRVA